MSGHAGGVARMTRVGCRHVLLADGWHSDAVIDIGQDGRISAIDLEPRRAPSVRLGGVVIAGIPNLHSHAHQRALTGLAEARRPGGDDFWSWRELMYQALQGLDPDTLAAIARQAYVEMLGQGYTSVAEFHYLHNAPGGRPYAEPAAMAVALLSAAEEVGIGITLLPVLYRRGGFDDQPLGAAQRRFALEFDAYAALYETLATRVRDRSTQRCGLAAHSLRAVAVEDLARLTALDALAPVHIHVAEQRAEVEDCLARTGRRPVQLLFERADVSPRWCLVHATHVGTEERRMLARSGATAGLCPSTEANLGDGLFPATEYLAAGGRLGIGSDSQVSVNPAEELRWLEYGQRLLRGGRNQLAPTAGGSTARALVEAVGVAGARACGLAAGRLQTGSRADLIELDPDHPRLIGRSGDGWLDAWIFSADDTPVRNVVVAGRHVVVEGRHPGAEAVARDFRRALAALSLGRPR